MYKNYRKISDIENKYLKMLLLTAQDSLEKLLANKFPEYFLEKIKSKKSLKNIVNLLKNLKSKEEVQKECKKRKIPIIIIDTEELPDEAEYRESDKCIIYENTKWAILWEHCYIGNAYFRHEHIYALAPFDMFR